MFLYLLHSIMVADGLNQSMSYAANFVLVRLISLSRIRRLLICVVVDDNDDSLSRLSRFLSVERFDDSIDAAENDDGDIDEDEFVDDREDTVDGVESNERDTTTDEPTTLAMVCFFFFATADDLPYFAFVGGVLLLFAMPVTVDGFVIFDKRVDWPAGRVFHLRMLRWKSSFMWNNIHKQRFGSFDVMFFFRCGFYEGIVLQKNPFIELSVELCLHR